MFARTLRIIEGEVIYYDSFAKSVRRSTARVQIGNLILQNLTGRQNRYSCSRRAEYPVVAKRA